MVKRGKTFQRIDELLRDAWEASAFLGVKLIGKVKT